MFDNYFRELKEELQKPLALKFSHIHPTTITLLALLCGLLSGLLLVQGFYGYGLLFWGLNRFLDGFDGTVARVHGKQSDLGGYLDILADFVVYAWLPIALVLGVPSVTTYLALAFMLASFYVNAASWMFLSSILEKRQHQKEKFTTITMPAGLIAGTETILFYCLFILLPQHLSLLYTIMGILVLLTVGQRLLWAVKNLRS
jgi:phosphatidylserine synthase